MDYRQKSKLFLFPLLCITNKASFTPHNTYLADTHKLITPDECRLIVTYSQEAANVDREKFDHFESKLLFGSRFFIDKYDTDELLVYIFDLKMYKEDFNNFLTGKYSKLTQSVKKKIDEFWSSNGRPNGYIRRFLWPMMPGAYEFFAEQYGVEVDVLKEGIELCSAPDIDKETLDSKKTQENLVV